MSSGPRLVLVAGTTETATIDGISAAGSAPELMATTPSADAELVIYGGPVRTDVVPVSPTGCPTPAVFTRAIRDLVDFDVTVVDGGLAEPTGAPTVSVGAGAGRDIRNADPVPTAPGAFEAARQFGQRIPEDEIVLAETIPGGTTTALGVLEALGEEGSVSSSLPENPLDKKRRVVSAALEESALEPGGAAGEPVRALRRVGDPVLAGVSGLALGALQSDTAVTFGGGTQLLAAIAVLRHLGVETPLSLATTSFVAQDPDANVQNLAAKLAVDLHVTDPGFEEENHPALDAYVGGEAKEGVGFGGALSLADRAGIPMERVRSRCIEVYDDLVEEVPPA